MPAIAIWWRPDVLSSLPGSDLQMAANGQVHENDIIVVHDYKNSFVGEKSILLILSAEVKGNAPYEMGQAVGGAPQQQVGSCCADGCDFAAI